MLEQHGFSFSGRHARDRRPRETPIIPSRPGPRHHGGEGGRIEARPADQGAVHVGLYRDLGDVVGSRCRRRECGSDPPRPGRTAVPASRDVRMRLLRPAPASRCARSRSPRRARRRSRAPPPARARGRQSGLRLPVQHAEGRTGLRSASVSPMHTIGRNPRRARRAPCGSHAHRSRRISSAAPSGPRSPHAPRRAAIAALTSPVNAPWVSQ